MGTTTTYAERQIHEIAGWKAEAPALVTEALEVVSHPVVKLVERFISLQSVRDAIEMAYRNAEILAHREPVAVRARVADVHELRRGDLARCDKLADEFARISTRQSAARGATVSAGALVGTELAMMYALKTVHTIGFCYGFAPEDPGEKNYALLILQIASAGSLREKQQAVVGLHGLENVLVEELVEEIAESGVEAVSERAIERMAGSSIPMLGLAMAGLSNAVVTSHTGYVAKRVYQERWLRANGKTESIAPDPQYARSRWQRGEQGVAGAVYWSGYALSFAVTFPACLLASFLPRGNAAVEGFVDGGAAARHDVRAFKGRVRRAVTATGKPETAPVPLPTSA